MSPDLLVLIVLHFACVDLTETQVPTQSEVEQCHAIHDRIKLAFVPGVSSENFAGLSNHEKAAVHAAGYLAFSDWRNANSETVLHLQRVARGEEPLKDASALQ